MPRPSKLVRKRRKSLAMARSALEQLKKPEQQVATRGAAGGTRESAGAPAASPPSAQPSTSLPKLTSAQKRKKLSPKIKEQKKSTSENFIIKKEDMVKLCEDLACKWCYESQLECKFIHHQVDIHVAITCGNCHRQVLNTAPEPVVSENARYFPFTLILVYIVMLLGVGYSGIETVCGMLSLKHFTFETYVRYAQYVISKAVEHTQDILMDSRKAVFKFYAEELGRHPDENGVLDVDCTFDGSWHTRGHTSHLCAAAVIEVNTHLVLDYVTLSKTCVPCRNHLAARTKKMITEEEYQEWKTNHEAVCDVNYEGTSGGMEVSAAITLWNRSLKHNMRYMHFVSDGDSAAFNAVKDCNDKAGPYGSDKVIEKWECINHVAKRLGTGLRNLRKDTYVEVLQSGKKRRRSALGGVRKLTDKVIDRLQHYFKQAIKRKVNTTEKELRNEIMASFYHCSSSDKDPKHDLCPRGEESWCFYQAALSKGETPPSHSEMKIFFSLPSEQLDLVKNVYSRLTSDEMMRRCLQGLTQNPNESFHSRIWMYCPKHLNATKRKLNFAAAVATANYNVGYISSNLHQRLGVTYTQILDKHLVKKDKKMDRPRAKKMRNRRLQRDIFYSPGGH